MQSQIREKSVLRILVDKIIIPATALFGGWLLAIYWPPALILYIVAFIALIIIANVNFVRKIK